MGVRLLGDVAVVREGEVEQTGSSQSRALLALLALRAGDGVEPDLLIDEVWGEELPDNPRPTLQVAVHRVRTWLGDKSLITASGGLYTLNVDRRDVDLLAFLDAADEALRGTDLARYDEAAALWREPVLPGLDSPRLAVARTHAEERHRTLVERHATLLVDAGRPEAVVDLLADADRLDERLAALFVRALSDAGRPRDAVEHFLDVRRRLRDDLGAEPGEELRELYASLARRRPPRRPEAPAIVGREELVATVLEHLHDDGRAVILEAPAGTGKTAVLRALTDAAHQAGTTTASSAWGPGGAPAEPWHEVAGDLGLSGRPDRSLGPWLHEGLGKVAADGPVLITLDDAHHADSASLDVLRGLARRGLPPGAVLVVAARVPDAVAHPEWHAVSADLARADGVEMPSLGPLPAHAVASLTRSRLAHLHPDDEFVGLVQARTHGHALHVAALLDVLRPARSLDDARSAIGTVPPQVLALIAHQVERLPEPTRSALEALAVLAPLSLTALADVLGRRPLQLADDLDPAARGGFVAPETDRFVLRHELDADALRARVPAVRAAHLHRARLETGGIDDAFVELRHCEGAVAVLEADRVADARVRAGVESYRRRALAEALVLFDAAEAASPDLVPALVVHRALCLGALAGMRRDDRDPRDPDDELDAAVDMALAAGEDELALRAAVGDEPLGLAIDGDPRRADRLRRLLDRPLSPRQRLELLAAYIREVGASAGPTVPELMAEARAVAPAVLAEDPAAVARVRALEARQVSDTTAPATERLELAVDAHALALATEDPILQIDALELLMSAELANGRTERAGKLRLELERAAARWFRPRSMWAAGVIEAAMLQAEGHPDAESTAQRAAARGAELGLPSAQIAVGAHLFASRLLAGTVAELGPLTAAASARAANTAAWAAATALAEMSAGHDDLAREHLAEYSRRAANPSMWFKRTAAAMAIGAAFGLGDAKVAASALAAFPSEPGGAVLVGFGGAIVGPEALWFGLSAWTRGDEATARQRFGEAVAFAERSGWVPWVTAARALRAAVDDGNAALPLGLRVSRRSP
ncbi:BTAD domain-containing putative transcriptional regulator [Actinomycetospora atypica]|uniref:BTAD domain-containing putative transcriptional regulator n=1 Tax=Actinomycetospora atypica TaxID=1290095 RepID=A0ABV9YJR7_9PSEU